MPKPARPRGASHQVTPMSDFAASPIEGVDFLRGGGEMAGRIRTFAWASTSLGPLDAWPQNLKTAVRIMLTSRQPMFIWWGSNLINLYNDAYQVFLARKHPSALGQPAAEVWREIWDQVGPRARSALFNNEGTYDESLQLIMERNGYPEETYYTFSYSPIPDDQGETGGILGIVSDDTQRIISERQLKLLRELAVHTADARTLEQACSLCCEGLQAAPHDLPLALIYLADPHQQTLVLQGRVGLAVDAPDVPEQIDLEDPAAELYRSVLRSQQLTTVSGWQTLLSAVHGGVWKRPPQQMVAVPIAPSGQKGRTGILLVGLNPYRLLDDDYRRFLHLVSSQISASIANAQAYENERARAEKLVELDRAKTTFFSNVSHEFRTPLTLLLGPLEDLLHDQQTQLSDAVRDTLTVATRNARRLLRLVNTLLEFSRIEAGRVQASYEPTDLARYTVDVASVFRSATDVAGLRLVIDCPPLAEPVYVDRDMWENIVLNLLSNAFKYTFDGEIAVTLRAYDGYACLSVRDSGTGIPDEEVPKLFNRFHRIESTPGRTHEGSGIGLALVGELAKLHGGSVDVATRLGEGSTFTVKIPLGKKHLPPERIVTPGTRKAHSHASAFVEEALRWLPGDGAARDSLPSADGAPSQMMHAVPTTAAGSTVQSQSSTARIVLADDNADMRDYVRRLLEELYEVVAVTDGQQALEACRQRPDLVITDIMMPRLDGFELVRALRSDPHTATVPVIMLSARAGEESRLGGLESGADDYLVKPFHARELLARVASQIAAARVRDETLKREQILRRESETLNAVARDLTAELDLQILLQKVTDAGTKLTRAQFGAFFYNHQNEHGEAYQLYALSGAPYEAFADFEMPRNTVLFEATYRGEGIVRLGDVTIDPRYGQSPPHYGLPPGHLPVRSYMAVPVVSRLGEVLGGLFFGHAEAGVFDERAERMAQGVAAQAAVAIDNARLYGKAKRELEHRASVEAALRETQRRYRQLVESVPAALYTCDRDGRIQLYNDAAVELWGRRPTADMAAWCAACRVLHPDGTPIPQEAWPVVVAVREKRPQSAEVIIERPDGSRRNVLAHPQPILDEDGDVQGLVNMLIDITDRKQAYAALRQSEERFSRFMQHLPGLAWLKDLDGRYVFVNQACEKLVGRPAKEMCGRTDEELFPPEAAALFRQHDQEALRSPAGIETIETLQGPDGIHTTLVSKFPVPGMDGQPTLIGGIAIDITERIRFEQHLRESEARFRNMADNAPVPIWLLGLNGCEFINREFERLWGLSLDDVGGMGWVNHIHPDDLEAFLAIYNDGFARQVPFEAHCRLLAASGEYRWVKSKAAPRFTEAGAFLGFVGCSVDITDIKQSENSLRQADRRKDEFLAVLAHELRNPLAPIRSGLELLRQQGLNEGPLEEICATMERQTRQMVRLIDDLLDVSRITRGTMELRKHVCTLASIVESAVEAVRPIVDEAGHQLHVELPAQRVVLEADSTRLAQVLSNLLNNAAKYMSPGGEIWLKAQQQDDTLSITVRDTGIGIPADMLESIFEMFTQVDRTLERSHSGLGIGLTLVKRLVEMHGGAVVARSAGRGQGSEFCVTLPLPKQRVEDASPHASRQPQQVASYRILVADDNVDAARMLALILDGLGHEVRTANDGQAALEVAAEFQPQVALIDIGMPKFNGYETAQRIRREPWGREMVLIAVTGWGQQEDKRLSREAGFDYHLVKPIDMDTVQRLLASRPRQK